jgi:hypothetical protein
VAPSVLHAVSHRHAAGAMTLANGTNHAGIPKAVKCPIWTTAGRAAGAGGRGESPVIVVRADDSFGHAPERW